MKRDDSPFLSREGGRGVRSAPTPLTLLAGLLALAFMLRWGGVSQPQFRSSDLVFHAHNLTYVLDVLHGSGKPFFFPGKLPNGTLVPYPSAYYVLLAPVAALGGGSNEAAIGLLLLASALVDSLVVLPVWALARRWGARAGLAAAALYALGPAPFQLFSAGNHTNLFAGATLVATLAAAAAALEQPAGSARRRPLAAFGAGSLLTLLSHYGVALSLVGVIGSVTVVWLVAAPSVLRPRIGPLAAVFALAVILAYVHYYVQFNAEMIAQVRGLVQRTAPPAARFTPGAPRITFTDATSSVLPSSASLPLRSTMAVSAWPATPSVLRMPAESISAEARTKTTSAMPSAVATVVALRTARLRRL